MKIINQQPISKDIIKEAFTYESFNSLVNELFEKGETTSGDNSQSMMDYTKLNISRTNRIDKKGVLEESTIGIIKEIQRPLIWLTITEGWCGDSAQLLPYIHLMAEENELIDLKIILRDEHPEIMDRFLTNGVSRSIPKVIILDGETLEPLADWGPRPSEVQETYLKEKNNPEVGGKQAAQNLHTFYSRNKGALLQEEFRALLQSV